MCIRDRFTGSAPVDFVTLLAAVQDAAVFETEDAAKVYLCLLYTSLPYALGEHPR